MAYMLKACSCHPLNRHVHENFKFLCFQQNGVRQKDIVIPFKMRGQPPETVKKQ